MPLAAQHFDLVKELGYAGIAWTETTPAQAIAAAERAEKRGLKKFAIYCQAKATPDGKLTHSPDLLKLTKDLLFTATINGADSGVKGGQWNRLIQTLDKGTFDTHIVLRKLRSIDCRRREELQT